MYLQVIRSEGLSHLSYFLSDGGEAAVIDPRIDHEVYLDLAAREGVRITRIFETHRNEDYVIGSLPLAARCGADIYHGSALDFGYGKPVNSGDRFEFGNVRMQVLETPGHTFESISIAIYDLEFGDDAVGVFTGDALFVGDVGRTDFFPDRKKEVAGLLYDSIHDKLLPLGDQVIVYPAHGAGSVCGSGMADREFSTLGYERRCNPRLQMSRDDFVAFKQREHHYYTPYFRRMEELNQRGIDRQFELARPLALTPSQLAEQQEAGAIVLDVRDAEAIAASLVPGSYGIPLDMVPAFAGWYLPYDRDILLIVGRDHDIEQAGRFLQRLGYGRITGFLAGGLTAWQTSGRPYDTIPAVHVDVLRRRADEDADYTLLDVRSIDEFESGHLPDAKHIYVGELADQIDQLPAARPVTTFCGSGQRALVAATVLKRQGIVEVEVCFGSMQACKAIGCKGLTD
jgi:hydroxyacylglutathione hydrolase